MSTYRMLICAAFAAATAAAHADVTVTTVTAGKASFINVGGEATPDQGHAPAHATRRSVGKAQSLIIDIDGRRFVDLDAKKKVRDGDAARLRSPTSCRKSASAPLQATLTKTAQTKQIAGYPVHRARHQTCRCRSAPPARPARAWTSPWCCRARCASAPPRRASPTTRAFYKAAADSGFIFGDPRAAKSPTGAAQAKAYAALTRKMAEAGMALESHVTIDAVGRQPDGRHDGEARQERHHHDGHEDRGRRSARRCLRHSGRLQGEDAEVASYISRAHFAPCAPAARTRSR